MKTDDLIRAMAADRTRQRPVDQILALALAVGAAAAALLFWGAYGVRPDLAEALRQAGTIAKHLFPAAILVAAFGACLRLARPEARPGVWGWAVAATLGLGLAAFLGAALTRPASDWVSGIAGRHGPLVCLIGVPSVSLPVLAAAFWALRRGASLHPRLSGALAGVLAGAAGASVYAVNCIEDDPMFWGLWYLAGIGIVGLAGAALGPRMLRW